ncbi:MAG: ABC transporter substrate-binding protein [Rhodospirillaceae bacterium]|nr:ABC transporter substrate-binding protein [Rhodospirillaceae bacterium]
MTARAAVLVAALLAGLSPADAFDIRYGSKGVPPSFGNPFMANGSPSSYTWAAMFDGLTQLDPDGGLQPALALGWENIEPTLWRFRLRPDVTFSNGEPFTADAVVKTIAWLKTPDGARSVIGTEIRDVVTAEKVDDLTVIIRTEKPDAVLPRRMSAVSMVAPQAWAELGPDKFAQTPATTGSFKVVDWGAGAGRIRFDAFKQSWRAPKAERLTIINLPDNPARVQALLSRQIDIAGNLGVDDVATIEAAGGVVVRGPAMSVQSLAFRVDPARPSPANDVRVRRALNYAVDKQAIVAGLLAGLTVPSGQPASRETAGYNPDVTPYPFDPDKARALLAEAGYGPDRPLKLRFQVMIDRTPADAAIYQTTAEMLAKVGVDLELQTVTFPTWLNLYLTGTWPAETDGFVLGWNAAPYNDIARPMEIYSCLRPNPHFCDRVITDQLETANQELDPVKREALLRDLARAYHDAAPAIFLIEVFDLFGAGAHVTGLSLANRVPEYHKVEIAR